MAKNASKKTNGSTHEDESPRKATPSANAKPQAPAGYQEQSDNVDGFWDPDAGPLHFIPESARIFDGKLEPAKCSGLILGTLVDPAILTTDDGEVFEGKPGTKVGVWAKPGMSAIQKLAQVKVFLYLDGEKDTGKPNPMKVFCVMSAKKGVPIPVTDSRKLSRRARTFLIPDITEDDHPDAPRDYDESDPADEYDRS